MNKFVPKNFKIPLKLETNKLRLRMLTENDVEKDYKAVMSSIDHLRGVFGPGSEWPQNNLSLEEDKKDLLVHEKEFLNRLAFAYTVINLDESKCLGCVYIMPSEKKQFDAVVVMWVIKNELKNGLDEELFGVVKSWIKKEWPFKKVAYPGRLLDWDKF